MELMESSPVARCLLAVGLASVLGFGLGYGRRSMRDESARVPPVNRLQLLSPMLERGRFVGDAFVGEVPAATWAQMSGDERLAAANELSIRLIDLEHVPSAVVFSNERVIIQIAQTNARIVE